MKDMVSRFGVLPYMGCLSQSNPAEFNQSQSRKGMAESNKVVEEESSSSMVKIKKSWSSVAPSRSNITRAMDKLIRLTFRGFTQVFAYKDIEDIKTETEMEIGFPTDVKHVTHIGYDGLTITETDKNRDHFQLQPLETLSFPSVSLKQIELAMAAQTETTSNCS